MSKIHTVTLNCTLRKFVLTVILHANGKLVGFWYMVGYVELPFCHPKFDAKVCAFEAIFNLKIFFKKRIEIVTKESSTVPFQLV